MFREWQPSLFLSHGAPDLAVSDVPARAFLRQLGSTLARPDAIVIMSAHHETDGVAVRAPVRFRTWHDFGNFGPELHALRYEPPGAPALGEKVFHLLDEAGLAPRRDASELIDHGAWVPLMQLFPAADIPLVMVSIDPRRDSRWHEAIGRALAPLRARSILLIGSGSISHNLRAVFSPGAKDRSWAEDFTGWLDSTIRDGNRDALLDTMQEAPDAARNHPTDEHLLPLFFAYGAGGSETGRRLHHSYTWEVLAMDAYAFGEIG
jgi:4,5-DOPA dioxygenase extradiol